MTQQGLSVRSLTDRRQPQRSDQRRIAILESLDHHLRQTGFESLNIAEVARRAGVTRSAFYFYFENKAAALAALLEPMYTDVFVANDILTDSTGPPRHRIRAMLTALLDTGERHRYLLEAMIEARTTSSAVREIWDTARQSFVPAVAAMIDDERAAGRAPGGPDAAVLADMLVEFNDRLLERFTVDTALSRAQLLEGAETIWLRALFGVVE